MKVFHILETEGIGFKYQKNHMLKYLVHIKKLEWVFGTLLWSKSQGLEQFIEPLKNILLNSVLTSYMMHIKKDFLWEQGHTELKHKQNQFQIMLMLFQAYIMLILKDRITKLLNVIILGVNRTNLNQIFGVKNQVDGHQNSKGKQVTSKQMMDNSFQILKVSMQILKLLCMRVQ